MLRLLLIAKKPAKPKIARFFDSRFQATAVKTAVNRRFSPHPTAGNKKENPQTVMVQGFSVLVRQSEKRSKGFHARTGDDIIKKKRRKA